MYIFIQCIGDRKEKQMKYTPKLRVLDAVHSKTKCRWKYIPKPNVWEGRTCPLFLVSFGTYRKINCRAQWFRS